MEEIKKTPKTPRISHEALQLKTGKNWQEWFAILDKVGAKRMNHAQIAAYLYKKRSMPRWWSQTVAVGYEQARGLREVHERPDGYEISVSRTVGVPVSALYRAWVDQKARSRWLSSTPITIRKANANKYLRVTWADNKTSLEVNFYQKGTSKTQVTVQHAKLAGSKAAAKMKTYWSSTLDGLKQLLER